MELAVRSGMLVMTCILLNGCASTINSIFERSVSSEPIDRGQFLTMTGERRVAVVFDPRQPYMVCAESLPDAARAAGARSAADVDLGTAGGQARGALGFDDQFVTALVQTNTRSEVSDVVRHLAFQACSAYANRGISPAEYGAMLRQIISGANAAMLARANQPIAPAGGTVQVNMGQPVLRRAPTAAAPAPAAAAGR